MKTLNHEPNKGCGHFFDISQKGIDIQKILISPISILNYSSYLCTRNRDDCICFH